MHILVVCDDFPWPENYGAALRLGHHVESLARLGTIDLFSLVWPLRSDPTDPPSGLSIRRQKIVTNSISDYSIEKRLKWLVSGSPLELVAQSDIGLERELAGWAEPSYDLVFVSRPETYVRVGSPKLGPTIVDYVDLESEKILARVDSETAIGRTKGFDPRLLGATVQNRLNAKRWRSLEHRVAVSSDGVICCSAEDRTRLRVPAAVVVPNCFDAPDNPVGTAVVNDPPTVLFQGSLRYPANTDAARRLVNEVLPRVRSVISNVELRLVGDADPGVVRLNDPPLVTVTGRVPEMEPELERADIVAVPLRFASGTRLKILEAMAQRIPVVATTIAAEGLGLKDGTHALIRDDMDSFAGACVDLLRDVALRSELIDAAQSHFLEHFQWAVAQDDLQSLALRIAGR